MKPIKVTLSLPIVAPLLDVVKDLADGLKGKLAVNADLPEADLDFRDQWSSELLRAQNDDLDALLGLFNEEFFTNGEVTFDQNNAESIARACSAVRLLLRERDLKTLGDETLETGDVAVANLDEATRKAFMCYLFLATIQELIIQHLDEGLVG
jgi:hypothetical protein